MHQVSMLAVGLVLALEIAALTIAHWSIFYAQPVPSSTDAAPYQHTSIVELGGLENVATID
jgi:hypothetical protein